MKRNCPTIQELLAFDAVARYESLTKAASSLCISVSAVSKQMAGLEAYLGRPLLQKHGRGVELTMAGREYLARVSTSLRTLETATFEFRAGVGGSGVIALASVPTFLTKWLIPRLVDFRRLHPGVTFSFSQHLSGSESLPPDIDAAIRYGSGDWPTTRADYVAGKDFVCVYSPTIFAESKALITSSDMMRETLLHHVQSPLAWRNWARDHDIDEAFTLPGPRFAQYSAIIQAAVSGLGVAIVPEILVEEELAQRSLIQYGKSLEFEHGHYLCFDNARLDRPVFAAFRSWILAQGHMQAKKSP